MVVEICIDTETTGLKPEENRILQLACSCGEKKFKSFIKYKDNKISADTKKFHGEEFMTRWAEEAVTEEEFGIAFKKYLNSLGAKKKKDVLFIAHNAQFDKSFCLESWEDVRLKDFFDVEWRCTLLLARKMFPKLKSRTLGALAETMGIKVAGRLHEADTDTDILVEINEVFKLIESRNKK